MRQLHAEVRRAAAAKDGSAAGHARWTVAAREFRDASRELYAPYEDVLAGIRAARVDAMEEGVRFLTADPWCFRSGYLKADLMHALANRPVPDHLLEPLRQVVLRRVTNRQPRLLRYAAQLAANVWSTSFEGEPEAMTANVSAEDRNAARAVLDGARQRLRSIGPQAGAGSSRRPASR